MGKNWIVGIGVADKVYDKTTFDIKLVCCT